MRRISPCSSLNISASSHVHGVVGPAVTARPGRPPYDLVHYACSIEEAVATEYTDEELPVYRRWKATSADSAG